MKPPVAKSGLRRLQLKGRSQILCWLGKSYRTAGLFHAGVDATFIADRRAGWVKLAHLIAAAKRSLTAMFDNLYDVKRKPTGNEYAKREVMCSHGRMPDRREHRRRWLKKPRRYRL